MTLEDTPEDAAVRAEIRAFVDEHAAHYGRARGRIQMHDTLEYTEACRKWQAVLDTGRWAAPTWPEAHGGRGLSSSQARIVAEEQVRYDVPVGSFSIAVAMVGPVLMAHGTPEQQARFLEPIRTGEHIWCQLFSEPDAGSDLASLRTRAELDGDHWVVTGQKVWTSGAKFSDWAILLARTEPGSWRHKGITYFLVDMRSPGIDVRPIVQINRNHHFNEVHLDEVRIPVGNVVGEVGDGWTVARTTLTAERVMIGGISVIDHVEAIVAKAKETGRSTDPAMRQALARAHTRATLLRYLSDRVEAARRQGKRPGAEASVIKLLLSTFMGELGDLAMAVAGDEGLLAGDGDNGYGYLQDLFLGQWATRIGGGTEQIQRNLIGEAVLGLPRDPRPTPPDQTPADQTPADQTPADQTPADSKAAGAR